MSRRSWDENNVVLRSFGVLRVHTSLSVDQVDRPGDCLDLICHIGSCLTLSGHDLKDGERVGKSS